MFIFSNMVQIGQGKKLDVSYVESNSYKSVHNLLSFWIGNNWYFLLMENMEYNC